MKLHHRIAKTTAIAMGFVLLGGSVAFAAALQVAAQKVTAYQTDTTVPMTVCTRTPTADAYVDEQGGNKNLNFGTDTTLQVQAKKNANKRSFLKFDIASCGIPAGAALQSASLRLFITTAPSSPRNYNAGLANAAWTETGITFGNQPGVLGTPGPATASIGSGSSGWFEWGVLSHVEAIRGGTTNNGWQVRDSFEPTGNDNTSVESQFSSREGANPPQLVIAYYP